MLLRTILFHKLSEFSLYPNSFVRIITHLLAWVFLFLLFLFNSKTLFKAGIYDVPVLIYSFVALMVIIINHYFLSYFTFNLLSRNKLPVIIIHLFCIYLFSTFTSLKLLMVLGKNYPVFTAFKTQSERRPINHLSDMFTYTSFIWVLTVIFFYNIIMLSLKFAKSNYESNRNNTLLKNENTTLELNFLRSQIQPHFLFNTLNNIYGLVLDNQQASESILKLSALLRFSLYESKAQFISVNRENEFLSDYINLEKMRHTSRVCINHTFSNVGNQSTMIAPLLLVNFVENAFKHGINSSIGHVWVDISLNIDDKKIFFRVENNKPQNDLHRASSGTKEGLGIENTKRRLDLIYPNKYLLKINENENSYTLILIIDLV